MLAVSGRWAAALRSNHQPIHRVQLWRTSSLLIDNLRVESGAVTKDAGRYPRTTATVTIADTSPAVAQLLTPFGYRLRFYRGLKYPDNTTEVVLYADLDIVRSTFTRPENSLTLELVDPSGIIAGDTLPGPTRPPDVTSAQDAITWLIGRSQYYGPDVELADSTGAARPIAPDWVADGDPWDSVEQLADAIGAEAFFTPARAPVLRPVPPIKTSADAQLYTRDGGTVTDLESVLERAPNIVYVWGAPQANGKPARGVAYDNDPNSPTNLDAAYGQMVSVINRPTPLTTAQANAAAATMLARVRGKVRNVTLQAIPDPAIEPGDTVQLRFASGALERHVVQSITIPIGGHDHMTVTTRTTAYTTASWP